MTMMMMMIIYAITVSQPLFIQGVLAYRFFTDDEYEQEQRAIDSWLRSTKAFGGKSAVMDWSEEHRRINYTTTKYGKRCWQMDPMSNIEEPVFLEDTLWNDNEYWNVTLLDCQNATEEVMNCNASAPVIGSCLVESGTPNLSLARLVFDGTAACSDIMDAIQMRYGSDDMEELEEECRRSSISTTGSGALDEEDVVEQVSTLE